MSPNITAVHPVLVSRDVLATVAFFRRLGFRVAFLDDPVSPRYAAVTRDAVELHLQWHDAAQWEHPYDRPTYRFLVPDVDNLYLKFLNSGALQGQQSARTPWSRPADTPWRTREFHVLDPDGNGLQFYRPLGADTSA